MKALLKLTLGLGLCLSLFGCSNPPVTKGPDGIISVAGRPLDPEKTGHAVKIAAKYGALAAIDKDDNSRAYFQLASGTIRALIASGNYDPATVRAALQNISIAEIRGDRNAAYFSDALELYQAFFADVVKAKLGEASPYLIPVLTGIADGAQEACDVTTPAQ